MVLALVLAPWCEWEAVQTKSKHILNRRYYLPFNARLFPFDLAPQIVDVKRG